jgi:hypothetical protein
MSTCAVPRVSSRHRKEMIAERNNESKEESGFSRGSTDIRVGASHNKRGRGRGVPSENENECASRARAPPPFAMSRTDQSRPVARRVDAASARGKSNTSPPLHAPF